MPTWKNSLPHLASHPGHLNDSRCNSFSNGARNPSSPSLGPRPTFLKEVRSLTDRRPTVVSRWRDQQPHHYYISGADRSCLLIGSNSSSTRGAPRGGNMPNIL
ncbi:hypothetical protein AVEN_200812-1 [Araneus ventricosus]|uniref:Uncharacterized protein n=1 Tax=Araneus ventricosus TaxID=182803 RepID=A0A4Y2CH64_ARAVE|nr:hypothetical protein AVEN_200812-1 [Araneus ventricosus]